MGTQTTDLIQEYATRVLSTQDVRQGSVAMGRHGQYPIPPLVVAAVLHSLADHTHNRFMVKKIIEERALATPGDWFEPEAISLGRYFHRLGDAIEDRRLTDPLFLMTGPELIAGRAHKIGYGGTDEQNIARATELLDGAADAPDDEKLDRLLQAAALLSLTIDRQQVHA